MLNFFNSMHVHAHIKPDDYSSKLYLDEKILNRKLNFVTLFLSLKSPSHTRNNHLYSH